MRIQSYTLLLAILFHTFFGSSVTYAASRNLYIYSELRTTTTGDLAMDLYQCILTETNFQPEVLTKAEKKFPRVDLIERSSEIQVDLHHESEIKELIYTGSNKNFVLPTCSAIKKNEISKGNQNSHANSSELRKIAPKWSLESGSTLLNETNPKPNFLKRNWPWLLGTAIAITAVVLIASKRASDTNQPSTINGSAVSVKRVVRGISVR